MQLNRSKLPKGHAISISKIFLSLQSIENIFNPNDWSFSCDKWYLERRNIRVQEKALHARSEIVYGIVLQALLQFSGLD